MLLVTDNKIDGDVALAYWNLYILGWNKRKFLAETSH